MRTKTFYALLGAAAVLAGCASATRVIATGSDTYMVTGQADVDPDQTVEARQAAIDRAIAYCAKLGGKRAVVDGFQLRDNNSLPFRCVEQTSVNAR